MAAWLNTCRFNPAAGGTGDWVYSSPVQGYQSPALAGAVNARVYKFRAESANLTQWEETEGAYDSATGTFARTTVLCNSSGTGTSAGQTGAGTKINFAAAPQVAVVALKEDLISIEEANAFTSAQQLQARSNIGAGGLAAMAAKNVIINPAVDISQEFLAVGATLVNNTQKYTADQWAGYYNHGATTAVVVSKQITMATLGAPLAGFQNGLLVQATTAISAPANGDVALHRNHVEGNRIAHWGWGAAGAAAISIAFQFYSAASGTAFVRLSNGATANRFYYHEITVAIGWNFYSFTVAGDTTGTWATDASKAFTVDIFSSGKETTPQASLDSWGAAGKLQTTNSTNLLGTNGNFTVVTGLYVDANGGQLPLAADLPLLMRSSDQEIELCKRYYQKTFPYATAPAQNAGATGAIGRVLQVNGIANWVEWRFPRTMRAVPTITAYNPSAANSNWSGTGNAYSTQDVSADHLTLSGGVVGPAGEQIHIVADARM